MNARIGSTLIALAILGCKPEIVSGQFACDPSSAKSCPEGWVCQRRAPSFELRCYSDEGPHCGDGVRNGGEECDGQDFGAASCTSHGYYGGTPRCGERCQLDLTACAGTCGDGAANGPEVCDGADLNGLACQSLGFYEGTLACAPGCSRVDASKCSSFCGDGQANGPEQCDGLDLKGRTCQEYGAQGGALKCGASCQLSPDGCVRSRWRQEAAVPQPLYAVWGTGEKVFAVGEAGFITAKGSTGWAPMTSNTDKTLRAIWGSSVTDVYAVGDQATMIHFDGTSWSKVTLPSLPAGTNLTSIWGSSASRIFAVGAPAQVLQYNGSSWSVLATPIKATAMPVGVSGFGDEVLVDTANDGIWAFSSAGWSQVAGSTYITLATNGLAAYGPRQFVLAGTNTLAFHDAGNWSAVQPTSGTMWYAAWGSGPKNVWMAGSLGAVAAWNGRDFAVYALPATVSCRGLWGRAENDVYLVGQMSKPAPTGGVIYHFDAVASLATPRDSMLDFDAVWGSGPDDVYIAGSGSGTGNPSYHFDGQRLSPGPFPQSLWVRGLWGSGPGDLWATAFCDGIYHWDGTNLTVSQPPLTVGGLPVGLRGIWGLSATEVYAVGGRGTVLRYDGKTWKPLAKGTSASLNVVWGVSGSDLFVGGEGIAQHFDGQSWKTLTLPAIPGSLPGTPPQVYAIWGSDPADVWMGVEDSLLHWDGKALTVERTARGDRVAGLWGTSAVDVWAAIMQAGVLHFDGSSWTRMTDPGFDMHNAIWGHSVHDFWVVGASNVVLHHSADLESVPDGSCARPVSLYCESALHGSNRGLASSFGDYPGAARADSGPEVVYRFDSPLDGVLSLTLTPAAGDLDLLAMDSDSLGACAPRSPVLGASQTAGNGAEQLRLPVQAGRTYYLVVDGFSGATTGYALASHCEKRPPLAAP